MTSTPAPAQTGRASRGSVPAGAWLTPDLKWLNTPAPLDEKTLRGKFLLLDFWTYCCINCMHILPELKQIEHAHPNHVVVIGVHSGKFDTERNDMENIREAILRYEIEHPVIDDRDFVLWNHFAVDTWPTLVLIDPLGNVVWEERGEHDFAKLDKLIRREVSHFRGKGPLDETPLVFNYERQQAMDTPLRFPGRVLADADGGRLFIADSNHHRIVVCNLDGNVLQTIGNGAIGRSDGGYAEATFHLPQGMALDGENLWVADTESHSIRRIDLKAKQVTTVVGTGRQRRELSHPTVKRFLGTPTRTLLSSPWGLCIVGSDLYIAMAGPHQIWKLSLDGAQVGVYAGNGTEDIVDGAPLPRGGFGGASFAQPSGICTDGKWLYVADSEGSSIRAVPLDQNKAVDTVMGTAGLPAEQRMFTFGDVDGQGPQVRLQHPLDVAYDRRGPTIYIADTYNSKIKALDLKRREVHTLAETVEVADGGGATTFNEPAGLSLARGKLYVADTNNHRICVVDPDDGQAVVLSIAGLQPPQAPEPAEALRVPGAKHVKLKTARVQPSAGSLTLAIDLTLPKGCKLNEAVPMRYSVTAAEAGGPVDPRCLGKTVKLDAHESAFEIRLPLVDDSGDTSLAVSLVFYYCLDDGGGLCKMGGVVWDVPIRLSSSAEREQVGLTYRVD